MGLSIQQDMYVQTLKAHTVILDARLQAIGKYIGWPVQQDPVMKNEYIILCDQILTIVKEIERVEALGKEDVKT